VVTSSPPARPTRPDPHRRTRTCVQSMVTRWGVERRSEVPTARTWADIKGWNPLIGTTIAGVPLPLFHFAPESRWQCPPRSRKERCERKAEARTPGPAIQFLPAEPHHQQGRRPRGLSGRPPDASSRPSPGSESEPSWSRDPLHASDGLFGMGAAPLKPRRTWRKTKTDVSLAAAMLRDVNRCRDSGNRLVCTI
jgi:hypothetical protein